MSYSCTAERKRQYEAPRENIDELFDEDASEDYLFGQDDASDHEEEDEEYSDDDELVDEDLGEEDLYYEVLYQDRSKAEGQVSNNEGQLVGQELEETPWSSQENNTSIAGIRVIPLPCLSIQEYGGVSSKRCHQDKEQDDQVPLSLKLTPPPPSETLWLNNSLAVEAPHEAQQQLNVGQWSLHEQQLFLIALQRHGKSIRNIAKDIKNFNFFERRCGR